MVTLAIDIETFSSVDLAKSGAYKYCESPDFEILIFAYSVDGGPVEVVDLGGGEELPTEIIDAITDPNVTKTAWNAAFERQGVGTHLWGNYRVKEACPPEQWSCTMVKAAMLGLPLSLGMAAKALKLDIEKDTAGTALINYFSKPCKPTKANGYRIRNYPKDNPEKWAQYKAYCKRDVEVEREIGRRLEFFTVPPQEVLLWNLDQRINDRGIMISRQMATNAVRFDAVGAEENLKLAQEITGLSNPKSISQLKQWLLEESGEEVKQLNKETVPLLLEKSSSEAMTEMLKLRQKMGKSSVSKYKAMLRYVCEDERVRGLHQFHAASTGRWAGRGPQGQNLPKNYMKAGILDFARNLVLRDDIDGMEMMFNDTPDTLSQLIRTAFIAKPGHRFIVVDFSAIEARVIAWLSGEKWRLDAFAKGADIYKESYSKMFGISIENVDEGMRYKGKVSELALGYQGSKGALVKMGALKPWKNKKGELQPGLAESELPGIVSSWRAASPTIQRLWKTCQQAAIYCIGDRVTVPIQKNINFSMQKGLMFIELPSGRKIAYVNAFLGEGEYGKEVRFWGVGDKKQWGVQKTYGGSLVENIVQGIARDCLAISMMAVTEAGYDLVLHVHDEVVIEAPNDFGSLKEVCDIMARPIPWAKGLPLAVEGFETNYYKK